MKASVSADYKKMQSKHVSMQIKLEILNLLFLKKTPHHLLSKKIIVALCTENYLDSSDYSVYQLGLISSEWNSRK